jgi:hypothetical protein
MRNVFECKEFYVKFHSLIQLEEKKDISLKLIMILLFSDLITILLFHARDVP